VFAIARVAGMTFLLVLAASVLGNALAYVGWANAWRRRDTTCELLDDEEPPPWPARAFTWLRTFAMECAAGTLLILAAPLDMGRERLRGGGVPVVIVTGLLQHRGQLAWLARRLRRDGRATFVTSAPGHDLESRAAALSETIQRVACERGVPSVDVVACGTGGLVARACVRVLGKRGGIGRLVTLGTPHQGTAGLPWLGRSGRLRELRLGSAFLRRLDTHDPVPVLADCVSIYSVDDALVLPAEAAYYGGAFNIELRGPGHLSLAYSGRVYELIRENLGAEMAPGRGTLPATDAGGG
jgi:triacylglycerol lipase